MATPKTKELLGGVDPPTIAQLKTLPAINPAANVVGVYVGCIWDPKGDNPRNFTYVGEGISQGEKFRVPTSLPPTGKRQEIDDIFDPIVSK